MATLFTILCAMVVAFFGGMLCGWVTKARIQGE